MNTAVTKTYVSDVFDPRMKVVVKIQWRNMAPVGALKGQSLAQNLEKGRKPSLASSCFTSLFFCKVLES